MYVSYNWDTVSPFERRLVKICFLRQFGSEQFQITLQWQFFCGETSNLDEIVSWKTGLSDKRGKGNLPKSK